MKKTMQISQILKLHVDWSLVFQSDYQNCKRREPFKRYKSFRVYGPKRGESTITHYDMSAHDMALQVDSFTDSEMLETLFDGMSLYCTQFHTAHIHGMSSNIHIHIALATVALDFSLHL